MTFAQLDDQFDDHPKNADYDLAEMGLLACGITYANRHLTDGVIPKAWPKRRFPKHGPAALKRLLEDGRWTLRQDGDYDIVGFLDHNPSREQVLERRRKKTEEKSHAGQLGGLKSGEARRRNAEAKRSSVEADTKQPASSCLDSASSTAKQNEALSDPIRSKRERTPAPFGGTPSGMNEANREWGIEPAVESGARLRVVPPVNPGPQPIPPGLPLTDEARAGAAMLGVQDIDAEWAKFVAYQQKAGRVATDWYAGWRLWTLDAAKFQRRDRERERNRGPGFKRQTLQPAAEGAPWMRDDYDGTGGLR